MSSFSKALSQVPITERPPVEINERRELEYAGSGIAVVAARQLTLGEALRPLQVLRAGESEPVAAQVPLSVLTEHPQLEPLLSRGTVIEDEPEPLVQIPWPLWQEHAEQAVEFWLPERDAHGVDRALALRVREMRFSQRETETHSFLRNCLVYVEIKLGRSRRDIAELADMSPTRVHQLGDDPPYEVREFVRIAALVAGLLGKKPCPRKQVPQPRDVDAAELGDVVDSMLAIGLLDEGPEGLRLTDDGLALGGFGAPSGRSRRGRKQRADGERAGDAPQ